MLGRVYTTRQVADLFGVSPKTVDKWRKDGILRAATLGYRTVRFYESEIERFQRNWMPKEVLVPKEED